MRMAWPLVSSGTLLRPSGHEGQARSGEQKRGALAAHTRDPRGSCQFLTPGLHQLVIHFDSFFGSVSFMFFVVSVP
jgi:hypothetical protein